MVNSRHHRLLEANTQFGEDRRESRSEGVKVLLRFPDVENPDLPLRLQSDVVRAPLGHAGPGCLKLFDRTGVLLRRESLVHEIDPKCHPAPPLCALDAMLMLRPIRIGRSCWEAISHPATLAGGRW